MAKDVATFLTWCAEPEHDERKRMGLKAMSVLSLLSLGLSPCGCCSCCVRWVFLTLGSAGMWYMKRHRWMALKSRQIVYTGK